MNFSELQKFKNTWFWILICIGSIYLIAKVFITKNSGQNMPPVLHFIFLFSAFSTAIVFWLMKLQTHIDSTGIRVQFSIFPFSKQEWKWGDIQKAYLRDYKFFREYGGRGLRFSPRHGRAFMISGNTGLQLELSNGKKVLIGTQKEAELKQVLQYLKEQYRIQAIELNA